MLVLKTWLLELMPFFPDAKDILNKYYGPMKFYYPGPKFPRLGSELFDYFYHIFTPKYNSFKSDTFHDYALFGFSVENHVKKENIELFSYQQLLLLFRYSCIATNVSDRWRNEEIKTKHFHLKIMVNGVLQCINIPLENTYPRSVLSAVTRVDGRTFVPLNALNSTSSKQTEFTGELFFHCLLTDSEHLYSFSQVLLRQWPLEACQNIFYDYKQHCVRTCFPVTKVIPFRCLGENVEWFRMINNITKYKAQVTKISLKVSVCVNR